MSRTMKLHILSYDISSDKRRRRVASFIGEEATRIQCSVFEARLSAPALSRLTSQVEAESAESDSLRVYIVGAVADRHCAVNGLGPPVDHDANYWLY